MKLRLATTLVGCGILSALTILSLHDASTVGVASTLFLVAVPLVPLVACFVNAALAVEPPSYLRDGLVPAGAFYASVLGASITAAGAGLNWLVFAVLYLLAASGIGYVAGKSLHARRAK